MLKNIHFLLVDDDNDDTFLFEDVLLNIEPSAHFNSAANGIEALQKLRAGTALPDIIFLDLNMPGMDGKECLAQLKKDTALKSIPVIIYTTSSLSKDIELTMQMGPA
jgi:CheY-like chemotaxis protein